MKGLLWSFGKFLAILPTRCVECLSILLGRGFYYTFPDRRRTILSNLDHAFPEHSWSWKRRVGKISCGRMVEMGCLALASPFFTETRIRRNSSLSGKLRKLLTEISSHPRPVVLWIPHLSMLESATWLPLLMPMLFPKIPIGVLFRPLKNLWLNTWIHRTRERFGVKLIARKNGLLKAREIIRSNGIVAFFGDQNAGESGVLTNFMGRLASTSDLVNLLAEQKDTEVYALWTRRLGFAKIRFEIELLSKEPQEKSWTQVGNRWLECLLRSDESVCEDWLWVHRRWHTQDEPHSFLHLSHKRNAFAMDPFVQKDIIRSKKTRIWVRLPNWLGDFIMAVPLLRELRVMRPDAAITFVGQASFASLISRWNLADCFLKLPHKDWKYLWKVCSLRCEIPDFYILLTNSLRGDLEAKILRSHQTFGLQFPKKRRFFVRNRWHVPSDALELHQTLLWEHFFRSMGMREEISRVPQEAHMRPDARVVGFVCGSSNMPEKRWPIAYWTQLALRLLNYGHCEKIVLFGTPQDAAILSSCEEFSNKRIINLAGKTDLNGLAEALSRCSVVMGNDTGGAHLANALGIPTVVFYGPTSSQRAGLFFDAPHIALHSMGKGTMEGISVDRAEEGVLLLLS
ncbi:MAG: hypothetical protein LBG98_01465 [Puniceicoccales bacterium]|nr:hypothetical protein [Puniceicoccales bacterium]